MKDRLSLTVTQAVCLALVLGKESHGVSFGDILWVLFNEFWK
jgi:hypothetical protein